MLYSPQWWPNFLWKKPVEEEDDFVLINIWMWLKMKCGQKSFAYRGGGGGLRFETHCQMTVGQLILFHRLRWSWRIVTASIFVGFCKSNDYIRIIRRAIYKWIDQKSYMWKEVISIGIIRWWNKWKSYMWKEVIVDEISVGEEAANIDRITPMNRIFLFFLIGNYYTLSSYILWIVGFLARPPVKQICNLRVMVWHTQVMLATVFVFKWLYEDMTGPWCCL